MLDLMARPSKRTSLACLAKKRLISLAREFELDVAQTEPKDTFVEVIARSELRSFRELLDHLSLAELRSVCLGHDLPKSGNKAALVDRILGEIDSLPSPQTHTRISSPAVETATKVPTTAKVRDALERERLFDLKFMIDTDQGLTKTYNALKDPDNSVGKQAKRGKKKNTAQLGIEGVD
jgi:hypothetical protein